jgi:hypothetical protein
VDGSAISSTGVDVDPFLASWNERAGIHSKVGTVVAQERPFSGSIRNEEAACCFRAEMCRQ